MGRISQRAVAGWERFPREGAGGGAAGIDSWPVSCTKIGRCMTEPRSEGSCCRSSCCLMKVRTAWSCACPAGEPWAWCGGGTVATSTRAPACRFGLTYRWYVLSGAREMRWTHPVTCSMSPACMSEAADPGEEARTVWSAFSGGPWRARRLATLMAVGISAGSVEPTGLPCPFTELRPVVRLEAGRGTSFGCLIGSWSASTGDGLPGGCPLSIRKACAQNP